MPVWSAPPWFWQQAQPLTDFRQAEPNEGAAPTDGMEVRFVYDDTALWMRRWRWFFLATSGLFGYAGGDEWGVSHYRLKPVG